MSKMTAEREKVDLTEDRLIPCGWGLVFKAVCTPAYWTADRVSDEATRLDPPGTSLNRWTVSEPDEERDEPFKGTNCICCPDDPNRRHWLVNC